MRPLFLLATFLTLAAATHAQINGALVLKRHNTVLQRYYTYRGITFVNQEGQRITGVIAGGSPDSVYLRFYDIRRGVNYWGLPTWDTVAAIPIPYALSDIKYVLRTRTGLNYEADGTILISAAVVLQVLELINGAYLHQPAKDWFTSGSALTSLGLAGLGAWLLTLQTKRYRLGRRYHLEYYGFATPGAAPPPPLPKTPMKSVAPPIKD